MCGIAGLIDLGASTPGETLAAAAHAMADTLRHRGPDDEGTWVDAEAGLAFGHRRLAIIDLSAEGAQPMVSRDGRWVLSYNGEVYNYREMRAELEGRGQRFRGASDSEVLLEWIAERGVSDALMRANAMAALAVWDRRERTLWLARDRFGEKPLYWTDRDGLLVFGSELRAITTGLRFLGRGGPSVSRPAVCSLLRHSYVPAPYSIYEGVRKVEPGTALAFKVGRGSGIATMSRTVYWSALEVAAGKARQRTDGPRDRVAEADAVETALRRSVTQRMVSDVPLGAFLSGGIDSSTVVALMQASSDRPVKTFTIGFNEAEFNEAEQAKAIAAHLGTDHTELYVSSETARAVIPRLADMYDEPFGDSSQIPTYLVSEMARQHVTVALSGDGGDEVFAGYNRYVLLGDLWQRLSRIPRPLRRAGARALLALPAGLLDRAVRPISGLLPAGARRNPSAKLHKLARVMSAPSPGAVYERLTSLWPDPRAAMLGGSELSEFDFPVLGGIAGALPSAVEEAIALDTISYLPDDILVKVDRAAMAVSLETRVPFLDPEVFALAWSLPMAARLDDGVGKVVLREVLSRHVPRELFERPKWGFGVPLGDWLRGPLHEWAGDLLSPTSLRRSGYFDDVEVQRVWNDHMAGRADRAHELWNVIVFEQWLAHQLAPSGR